MLEHFDKFEVRFSSLPVDAEQGLEWAEGLSRCAAMELFAGVRLSFQRCSMCLTFRSPCIPITRQAVRTENKGIYAAVQSVYNMCMDGSTLEDQTNRSCTNGDIFVTDLTLNDTNETGRPSVLSLFCGCGGLDLGFEQAGFEVGLAYDLRESAVRSHNSARAKQSAFVRDVSKLSICELDHDFGGRFSPSGVIGGPPCQSFSRGNSSKSDDDPRKQMVARFFDLALKVHKERGEIDFIVMENVPEVAKADHGELLGQEIDRLKTAGFEVYFNIYNAADYGVAQRRRRLILVAINKKKLNSPWASPQKCPTRPTVRDEIFGLAEPVHYNASKGLEKFPEHPNHWCMTPKSQKFSNSSL